MADLDQAAALERSRRFQAAAENEKITSARWNLLETAGATFSSVAEHLQNQEGDAVEKGHLAAILLSRIAAELIRGIVSEFRQNRLYSGSVMLRQLIEVEYLMFLGYLDLEHLDTWLNADGKQLRKQFTPQRMRDQSDGLFRDEEYWMHCDVGGHPNPKARLVLSGYRHVMSPIAALLPDAVHHVARLWTSMQFVGKALVGEDFDRLEFVADMQVVKDGWREVEDDLVLAHDGIADEAGEDE